MSANPSSSSSSAANSTNSTSSPSFPDPNTPVTFAFMSDMFTQLLRDQRDTVSAAVQAALQQQAASAASQASSSSSAGIPQLQLPARVKISLPPTYHGISTTNTETWLYQIEQYLVVSGVHDDLQRIAVAVSLFRDLASQWWIHRSEVRHDAPTHWALFKTAVRERFQPVAASRTARAELRSLRQGSSSIAEYQAAFYKTIQLINDMSEADQIENFMIGLRSSIAAEVDRCNPKTLQQAMIEAQKAETRFKNFKQFSSSGYYPAATYHARPSYAESPTVTTPTTTTSASTAPMELGNLNATASNDEDGLVEREFQLFNELGDEYEPSAEWLASIQAAEDEKESENAKPELHAMQHRGPRRPPQRFAPSMPKEEFARLMKAGLCLRCKKPGHIARNCPVAPRTQAQRRF
jgi:Retrotransposon gag protein